MVAPLQIGGGITFEGGISVGANAITSTSFTISPSDFTNAGNGQSITVNTPTGFTNNGTRGPGVNCYGPNLGTQRWY